MKIQKVMIVFGTRPEAIKMCPLIRELKQKSNFDVVVCVTGQHKEMLQQVLKVFDIFPNYDLKVMSQNQTLFDITENILNRLKNILSKERPDILLVHGDTTTTFAASLAAFYTGIKIGHVEAGLRTYNLKSPYPEEFNRQAVSLIADYHFAPTLEAKNNLIREGKNNEKIFVTGNTAIDALKTTIRDDFEHPLIDWIRDKRLIILTAHRRENIGLPMVNMFKAIKRVLHEITDIKILYPVHKNPRIRAIVHEILGDDERIKIVEPLEVVEFHNLLNASYLILTDSGGVQEEAPSLGKPVLVMRDTTERPEGIKAGTLRLVGTTEEGIYNQFKKLLTDDDEYFKMSCIENPYGDGTACSRIRKILESDI